MAYLTNPILTGFNPDPSILRVGKDYYIATSTFEWFPGVQIHHSTDLIHWELICHPLNRLSQLNMLGEQSSCGIWAPCLSYSNGTYYLIYTDVKAFLGMFKDTHNYLVTALDINGPWSEPVYLNSSGFDPSLFHDDNGKKYLLNMLMDHRSWRTKFGGIVMQEYSEEKKALVGEPINIFKGTQIRFTEGPHLYKHDGYYYLMTAEGGTEYGHAVTMARSRNIEGPYEVDPLNPILTSLHTPQNPLQKAGHASLCEGHNGKWYMAHLCGRPVNDNKCILGRETSLQEVVWKDGWLRLANGTNYPSVTVEVDEADGDLAVEKKYMMEDFDKDNWSIHLQTLRVPLAERASLKERPGYLRLYGKESFTSCFHQSLLAHRQQSFYCEATTKVDFSPKTFQQMAGLVYYYDSLSYYYLYITDDEVLGRVLTIMTNVLGKGSYPIGVGIPLPAEGEVYLRLTTDKEK
ncbi:MAG TPA: glycoside hydrolase family 43 protein, partial [Mobilitalea sp.]|nr:glycoside hydrolase family 43 protein [Mobilitalea sp.]